MIKKLTSFIGVYQDEIRLFFWSMLLLLIVRSGGTILTNYADAVFLKRYGVEYLPIVNMLNAVATIFVMGAFAGLMQKMSGSALLLRMFLVSGVTMAIIRLVIPLEYGLIYPLLFMLKAQYEILLALLFWNLANDLFNTQQAKRLFPLITAGGVIGQIIASFGTPWFARVLSFDNLLFAYFLICCAGAAAVFFMSRRFPMLLSGGGSRKAGPAGDKPSMAEEFRRVWPMVKSSTLVKIMIVLTFVPNVIIPILNYQFNYAVNEQFQSEDALLEFFGYMRGVLNIISLVLLLFVGKIYGRWGLPVALMFHPFNYVLAFLSFLFKFDVFSALYARMSTQILRTSINVPANAVLTGLFPQAYRAMVRPFLRGTVVRIGLFLGSSIILLSDALFHPRYLSLVAIPLVLIWLSVPFWLKRRYTDILTDLVAGDMRDIKAMETTDVHHLFRDQSMRRKLQEDFRQAPPEKALWFGQLLKSAKDKELDSLILEKVAADQPNGNGNNNADDRVALLDLLSARSAQAISTLDAVTQRDDPPMQVGAIRTLRRLAPDAIPDPVDLTLLVQAKDIDVRAHAAAAMLPVNSRHFSTLIKDWIQSPEPSIRQAGVVAAGASADAAFTQALRDRLTDESDPTIRAAALKSLHQIDPPEINELVAVDLHHESPQVRRMAVSATQVIDKASLRSVIESLGDLDQTVSQQAREQIVDAPYQDGKQLIKALSNPRRKVREEVFRTLEALDIKDLDAVRFVRDQAQGAYKYLAEVQAVDNMQECAARDLLSEHLSQQRQVQIENIVRVLASQDGSGKMRIVSRGLLSSDKRQRANSQEALGDLLDKSVARFMIPLVDESPIEMKLAAGKKFFKINPFPTGDVKIVNHLLESRNPVTCALAIEMAEQIGMTGINTNSKYHQEMPMESDAAISEKILLLKQIDIFSSLSVAELSAVATITEEVDHPPGERVISQDTAGETLYLIVNGTVEVRKQLEDGSEMKLDEMSGGDYFGEMALFEDNKRSANVVTATDSRLLFLHKQDFNEMVREYPQIALAICGVLSGRIRRLHERFQEH